MAQPFSIEDIALELESYWAQRKLALLKLWDYYYGDRQRYYLSRFEGETEEEYLNRVLNATIENHCAKTCDVLVSYLYGQPESKSRVNVKVVDADGEIIEPIQRLLRDNVWDFNDIDSFRVDVALMSSVTGVGIVFKQFVDKRTGLPFSQTASREDKRKYGTVRYEVFDTVDTMPLPYVEQNGVIHSRLLGSIVRYYNQDNFSGVTMLDKLMQKRYQEEEILEFFDGERMVRAIKQQGSKLQIVSQQANVYNNINTLFTLFRNYGDPMYLEGQSDLAQMPSLQNSLNEIVNDDRTTISYHSFPILVLTGGAKLPENFVRKVNSALELDVNQDIKYLTWDNVLEASAVFKEETRKQMTVVSGVSQISRGNAADIGQIRSGAGLRTLFQADINAVALKVPYFRKAEAELVRSTLAMWSQETGEQLPEDFRVIVEFPEDFVGIDELLKAQTEQIELQSGSRSMEEVIRKKHPDIVSEEEVDEIVEEVKEGLELVANASKPAVPEAKTPQEKSNEQRT